MIGALIINVLFASMAIVKGNVPFISPVWVIAKRLKSNCHIGDDVVIGSGSVVTKDIPSHVIAAGVPCRVIREITDTDRNYWKEQYSDYEKERSSTSIF